MEKLYIISIDDQREVLLTLSKDLKLFESFVLLEECESAKEALDLVEEIDSEGNYVAVIISDHIMPGTCGVEFLTTLNNDDRFALTKKILLTGQATHKDTINAINKAKVHNYIEKPWSSNDLVESVKKLLTTFILEVGLEHKHFTPILDQDCLLKLLYKKG